MVTYGFYNSIDHDRVYDATQMSEIFDGIIRDGVYQYVGSHFAVDVDNLNGFQVRVGTGRAWFNHTWTKNDAPLILTLPAPPTLDNYYRSDAIVIDIDANVNVRENKITYVEGTAVANNPNPPRPELLDGAHKQVPLAYITRVGGEITINPANIQYVVGSSPCVYVTSPVQAVDLSTHVAQWEAAWNQWFNETKAAFNAAITAAISDVSTTRNTAKNTINEYVSEFSIWVASQKTQLNGWMSETKDDFDNWFANLQYILDGDVAGHLQNEIDVLTNRITPIKNGGTGNDNGHIQTGFTAYSNNSAEMDITDPGIFATSEGINTTAGGESSHAEGGGNYTYSYRPEHLEGDMICKTDETSEYPEHFLSPYWPSSTNIQGSENSNVHCQNWLGSEWGGMPFLNLDSDRDEPYGYDYWSAQLLSLWAVIELKDETTGEILKREIACIGANTSGNSKNIDLPKTEFQPSISVNTFENFGIFSTDYIDYNNKVGVSNSKSYSMVRLPKHYWYIDGDTPANSTILVEGTFAITINKLHNGHCYAEINLSNHGLFDEYGNYTPEHPENMEYFYGKQDTTLFGLTIKAGNTHTYSLNVYYSYSDEMGVDHPIVLVPAGNQLVKTGRGTLATGGFSHAEGYLTFADGDYSHAEGYGYSTKINPKQGPGAFGQASHTEGYATRTEGSGAHAEGRETLAKGNGSHAEGYKSESIGDYSHAEGSVAIATGAQSHAEGYHTEAIGNSSHVGGQYVSAYDKGQFVHGYTADPKNNLLSANQRLLYTTIVGFGGEPRWISSNTSEITAETLDELNEIVNKNRNGFSAILRCGSSINSIYYKTLMPSDTFGTFLEFIEVIAGDPVKQMISNSCRIVKLQPNGSSNCKFAVEYVLFDNHSGQSATAAATMPATIESITIDGTTYKHPMIYLRNPSSSMVSDSNKDVYIKYTLMRLI